MSGTLTRLRANYDQIAMLAGVAFAIPYIYFASTNLGALVFLWGLLCLWHLRSFKGFIPAAVLSGFLLLYGFFRSDFVAMIAAGKGVAEAYAASKRYFQAPMIMWFTAWALVLACRDLAVDKSGLVMKWLFRGILALSVIELLDAISGFGLRTQVNNIFHGGHRPEMLVVRTSNANMVLTMLFWPISYYLIQRRVFGPVIFMALSLVVTAFAVDTNAQIMALGLGVIVFAAVRFWPKALETKGIKPERVMAILASGTILGFPALIDWLMRTGLALKIKTDLLPSWADRIDIWSFAVARSLEKPVWGWGYEASRQFDPHIPNHPHSLSLQAWLELGIPGLVALAALWFCAFWFMAPKGEAIAPTQSQGLRDIDAAPEAVPEDYPAQVARPYFLAAATGYFAVNMISFGLWRMWYYCLGALTLGVALMAVKAVRAQLKLQN